MAVRATLAALLVGGLATVTAAERLQRSGSDPRAATADPWAERTPPLRDLRVTSIQLDELDAQGVRVAVTVTAVATVTATLQSLLFDHTSIDTLPLNLPPIDGPIKLRARETVALPVIRVRLSFRELDSLSPLRQLVTARTGRFHAVIRGRLSLNLFARLALRTSGAWVVTRVDQQVPVEAPGGRFGRDAAFGVLTLAEPLWRVARAVQARSDAAIAARASTALGQSVVALDTHYALESRTGQVSRMRHTAVGFLVDQSTILAPGEVVEPWLFDASVAEGLDHGDVTLVRSTVDIVATPAFSRIPDRPLSLRGGGLRVVKHVSATELAVSPTTRRRFALRLRSADANLALLRVSGWTSAGVEPLVRSDSPQWQPATIVRLRRDDARIEPLFMQTAIRSSNGRLELRDVVDAGAFGSPIWTEAGVAGIVQHASSGAGVVQALDALSFTVRPSVKHHIGARE
jgi:hypothetical protein